MAYPIVRRRASSQLAPAIAAGRGGCPPAGSRDRRPAAPPVVAPSLTPATATPSPTPSRNNPQEKKVPDLRSFYKKIENPDFRMTARRRCRRHSSPGLPPPPAAARRASHHPQPPAPETPQDCGTGEYKTLMEQFPKVVAVYLGLKPLYRAAIADITKRMGDGMADFIEKEVVTVEDYNLYCHYVAGLVGIGLSALFASSGLEGDEFRGLDELSNCMGLFLQKTNIIRDYLEARGGRPFPRTPTDPHGLYPRGGGGRRPFPGLSLCCVSPSCVRGRGGGDETGGAAR